MKRDIYEMANKCLAEMVAATREPVEVAYPKNPQNRECYFIRDDNKVRTSRSSTQILGVVYKDPEIGYGHVANRACSAGLNIGGLDEIAAVISLSQYDRGELKDEQLELFYDWYLNRSPYASIISTKSVRTAMSKGVIYSTYTPANLLVGATIVHRVAWEYTAVVESWVNFVKHGMNENAAFVLAHQFSCGQRSSITTAVYAGHCAINGGELDAKYIKNFNSCTMDKEIESYSTYRGYNNIHAAWGRGGGYVAQAVYKAYERALAGKGKEEEEKKVVIPNPFARSMVVKKNERYQTILTQGQRIKALVEWANKLTS